MFGGHVRVEAFSSLKGIGLELVTQILSDWYLSGAEAESEAEA